MNLIIKLSFAAIILLAAPYPLLAEEATEPTASAPAAEGPASTAQPLLSEKAPMPPAKTTSRVHLEYELDAYYSNVGLFIDLTDAPIPDVGKKPEFEVYRDLLLSSLVPRELLIEAGVFPMPDIGVQLKKRERAFYNSGEIIPHFNIIKAITTGFEEPYSLSIFLGNVVSFTDPDWSTKKQGNFGYMGYLVSVSNYHIKDNVLVRDTNTEIEWKIKGDRTFPTHELHWSFRIGGKIHDNPLIKDVLYIGLRRSRLDFEASSASFIDNSGFDLRADVDSATLQPISYRLLLEKKWPLNSAKMALTFTTGFIWEGSSKYTGTLADKASGKWQIVFQPNVQF